MVEKLVPSASGFAFAFAFANSYLPRCPRQPCRSRRICHRIRRWCANRGSGIFHFFSEFSTPNLMFQPPSRAVDMAKGPPRWTCVETPRVTPHATALRSCSSLLICLSACHCAEYLHHLHCSHATALSTIYALLAVIAVGDGRIAVALNACTIYAAARAQGDLWSRR